MSVNLGDANFCGLRRRVNCFHSGVLIIMFTFQLSSLGTMVLFVYASCQFLEPRCFMFIYMSCHFAVVFHVLLYSWIVVLTMNLILLKSHFGLSESLAFKL
jgi:hypothetical protein